jgi:hypothetical protein
MVVLGISNTEASALVVGEGAQGDDSLARLFGTCKLCRGFF